MPVVGVLVEAEVGHEHDLVAHGVAQGAQRHLDDAVGIPGPAPLRRPCEPARRRGSTPGRRGTLAAWPRPRASRRCAAPGRAWTRSAPGRRCLPGRRAAPPGRPPRGAPRRPAGAGPVCGEAGASVVPETWRRWTRSRWTRPWTQPTRPTGRRRPGRSGRPARRTMPSADAPHASCTPLEPAARAAAAVVGPMHTTCGGRPDRQAGLGAQRHERIAPPRWPSTSIASAASPGRAARVGMPQRARCGRPRLVSPSHPFSPSPSAMVSGARSAHGNRTRPSTGDRIGPPGTPRPGPGAVLGRHQVGLDAGQAQRVRRGRTDRGHRGAGRAPGRRGPRP